MANVRLIPRLDIKGPNLIKGVQLEGLRVIGPPMEYALQYYLDGADELIYIDIVASLYGRNQLLSLIEETSKNVFVPLTVGGGIQSIDDVKNILRAGADKVAINTAATKDPSLITKVAEKFGAQCMVLNIEAKRKPSGIGWEPLTENGREHTGMDVVEWAQKAVELGAGEILLTSIDQEGTRKGFDFELVKKVSEAVNVPIIASGGMGSVEDLEKVVKYSGATAVAMADILHYKRKNLKEIRSEVMKKNIPVRVL